jgi:hypothetical protein
VRYKLPSHTSQPIKNNVRHTPRPHSHQMIMEDTHIRYFTIILAPGDYNIWVGTGAQDYHYVTLVDIIQMIKRSSDCSSSPYSTCQHKLHGLQRMIMSPHWPCNRRHGEYTVSLKNRGYHNRGSTASTLLLAAHILHVHILYV